MFFETMFGRLSDYLGHIEIRAKKSQWDQGSSPFILRRYCKRISDAKAFIRELMESPIDYDIYFGVLPRFHSRHSRASDNADGSAYGLGGRKENIFKAGVVWADIDFKLVHEGDRSRFNLDWVYMGGDLGIAPSIVVESGSGYHCYWLLDATTDDLNMVEAINRGIVRVLGADRAATDRARVLRVPDTWNYKTRNARWVEAVKCEKLVYPISVFSGVAENCAPRLDTEPAEGSEFMSFDVESMRRRLGIYYEYVLRGLEADTNNFYQNDRSRLDFAVTLKLVRMGCADSEIRWLFLASPYPVSGKATEKDLNSRHTGLSYVNRTITQARELVERQGFYRP